MQKYDGNNDIDDEKVKTISKVEVVIISILIVALAMLFIDMLLVMTMLAMQTMAIASGIITMLVIQS